MGQINTVAYLVYLDLVSLLDFSAFCCYCVDFTKLYLNEYENSLEGLYSEHHTAVRWNIG